MVVDTTKAPRTKEVLLDGLQQALQARMVNIWTNVTLRGEPDPRKRFKEGVTEAVKYYEAAWKAIKEME